MTTTVYVVAGLLASHSLVAFVASRATRWAVGQENERLADKDATFQWSETTKDLASIGPVTPPRGQRQADDLDPEKFVSEGCPPEPYCPCGGQCHHGPHPCSMSCMAHHAVVMGGRS